MANVKSDRRVRYTKMVLKSALIELMAEKPLSKITIKEICEKADINRGTFYAHYTDQFDLQNQIFEEILDQISEYMDAFPSVPGAPEARTMLTSIFRFTHENRNMVKVLTGSNSTIRLQDEIRKFMITRNIFSDFPINPAKADYLYSFVAYSTVGIVQKWLDNGTESPEEIADFILQLTGSGFNSFK